MIDKLDIEKKTKKKTKSPIPNLEINKQTVNNEFFKSKLN